MKTIKCPWCGKVDVPVTRGGNLASHGRCVGAGQPAQQVADLNKLRAETPSAGRHLAERFKR